MTTSLERIDEILHENGFHFNVATNDRLFSSGDGDIIEDAPLGYYRFHFWKNEDTWKDHDNYVVNNDITGPICISVMQECAYQSKAIYHRLLIRTIFGCKSLILRDDTFRSFFRENNVKKALPTERILAAAVHHFIAHEKEKHPELAAEGKGAAGGGLGYLDDRTSIRSAMTSMTARSDRTKFLPHARLKEAAREMISIARASSSSLGGHSGSQGGGCSDLEAAKFIPTPTAPKRMIPLPINNCYNERAAHHAAAAIIMAAADGKPLAGSNASAPSTAEKKPSDPANAAVNRSQSIKKRLHQLSKIHTTDLAAQFTHIKDKELYKLLLNMENSLLPRVYNFDVILIREGSQSTPENWAKTWESFASILGQPITKTAFIRQSFFLSKQGRVPSNILSDLNWLHGSEAPAPKEMPRFEALGQQQRLLTEFIDTEKSYLEIIGLIDQAYIKPLDPRIDSTGTLSGEEYKRIFADIRPFIQFHTQFLADLTDCIKDDNIDTLNFSSALNKHTKEGREFYNYREYFSSFDARMQSLKKSLANNRAFAQYHEKCMAWPNIRRRGLDQLLIAPIQRIPRYVLLLREILKYTLPDDPAGTSLREAHKSMAAIAEFLDFAKKKTDQSTRLFEMHSTILNCPATLVHHERVFISKMSVYEVDTSVSGDGAGTSRIDESRRMTLFLCNDKLIAARKLQEPIRSATHEFVFMTDLRGVCAKEQQHHQPSTTGKGQASFMLEIKADGSIFRETAAPGSTKNRKKKKGKSAATKKAATSESPLDAVARQTVYQLLAKNPEKRMIFLKELADTRHQLYLTDSPATIYFYKTDEYDAYFHVFEMEAYEKWEHKHPAVILYSDQTAMKGLSEYITSSTDAVAVIQARQCAYRFNLRSRSMLYASNENFEAIREFLPADKLKPTLQKALANYHKLTSIYPPFSPDIEYQGRFLLERYVPTFCRSRLLAKGIKAVASLTGRFARVRLGDAGSDEACAQRMWDETMNGSGSSPLSSCLSPTFDESAAASHQRSPSSGKNKIWSLLSNSKASSPTRYSSMYDEIPRRTHFDTALKSIRSSSQEELDDGNNEGGSNADGSTADGDKHPRHNTTHSPAAIAVPLTAAAPAFYSPSATAASSSPFGSMPRHRHQQDLAQHGSGSNTTGGGLFASPLRNEVTGGGSSGFFAHSSSSNMLRSQSDSSANIL